MGRECQERFPRNRGLAIPTCITVSFEVGGRENVPSIPYGACATHNFTYLVSGPLGKQKTDWLL